MDKKELIVIGGGPVGITLAKKLGKHMDVAVVRPEDHSMIYCAMPYAVEGIMDEKKTFKKDSLVTDADAELIRDTVTSVDYENKTVSFEKRDKLGYDKLVIATGAVPFIPPVPGHDLKGVMGFKTQVDMEHISGLCEQGLQRAVVVGAGAIGIELAQALQFRGVKVSLVDMASSILPNLADSEMVEYPSEELTRTGMHMILNARVESLHGREFVEHVDLDNGERIHLDPKDEYSDGSEPVQRSLIVFATGVRAETALAENSEIEVGKDGIKVNSRMETNVPDVYACGDCTEYISGITGELIGGKLATNAVPMAKILAANLLGNTCDYPGFYNGAATKVQDWYVGGTGFTEANAQRAEFKTVVGYGETTTQFPIMPEAKPIRVKLIAEAGSGRLIGGQIVSGEAVTGRIDLLTYAIQMKSTLNDLLKLSYSAQPYQSFFPAANAIVLAVENALTKG